MGIALLVVATGPAPGVAHSPALAVLETLRHEQFAPHPDVECRYLPLPFLWHGAEDRMQAAAQSMDADAILLLDFHPSFAEAATGLALLTEARNLADCDAPDKSGVCWAGRRLMPSGPDRLQTTLAAARLQRDLAAYGVMVRCWPGEDGHLGNRLYFQALSTLPQSLRVLIPTPIEAARAYKLGWPAPINRVELVQAAKAVCAAWALHVAPIQSARAKTTG